MTDAERRIEGRRLHVRGIVQGVGFRPLTLRLARAHALAGSVRNEGTAVVVEAFGAARDLHRFQAALAAPESSRARVDALEAENLAVPDPLPRDFLILPSEEALPDLGIAPDLAACPACVAETFDPFARRYRYAFTACADCGPRFGVFERAPYDRANTTMAPFALCADCAKEYADLDDRRFHAQAIACHVCGPRARLVRLDGHAFALDALSFLDDADAATSLIGRGEIVLVKGIGGYQLACDAGNEDAVARLRALKQRHAKPFALMARDVEMARAYCAVEDAALAALTDASAPIVLLPRRDDAPALAAGIAPRLAMLGMMLPATPLHHLLMRRRRAPIVLTSGNLSEEPQAITFDAARARLARGVNYALDHDRAIARRLDDSVGRVVAGKFRLVRRARGIAPAPLPLPPGFDAQPQVLALGGDLKNTFALLRDGQGILSQHIGDLHDAACRADYEKALDDHLRHYRFAPDLVACDLHPRYAATQLGERRYANRLTRVGHHHAHIAACLGEHGWPREGGKVLGIALDGLGLGLDGALWGGEFLHCDYAACERVGSLKPVALPGGDLAAREPWRNLYAQIAAGMGWARFAADHGDLDVFGFLAAKPRDLLDGMLGNAHLAPVASSAGRLFDAVAAAVGICRERVSYEGEAAMGLENLIRAEDLREAAPGYPFAISPSTTTPRIPCLDPAPMWQALFADLARGTEPARIAARFHRGFAQAIVRMAAQLAAPLDCDTVALSGGVFHNRVLSERVLEGLAGEGLRALYPERLPANDGGLAWGQALVALARYSI